MPVRLPPENRYAPQSRGRSQPPSRRIVTYSEAEPSFGRRWLRRIFRPWIIIATVFLTTVTIGIFGYYWYVFSARVDKLLKGDIFTRSAGIYAAPRELHNGETLTSDVLIEYLKHAGYVLKGQQAEESRGRFSTIGDNIDIEPNGVATVDGINTFPRLRM